MIDINNLTIEGGSSEVTETLKTIFTTPKGTVPFDRNFGIDMSLLDDSMNDTKGKLIVEFIRQAQLYEPRVKVKEVNFTLDKDNNLMPKVRVE